MLFSGFLTFSDAAKFADIARNLINGLGYSGKFIFWSDSVFGSLKNIFSQPWIPPMMPYSIAAFFKIFGITDFAVIATSFFYFLLTLVFIFLLSKKIYKSNLIGILSTLTVGFNYDLINYATSGASESPFIFEIVAASYFVSLKKKWGTVIAFLFLVLMYFTRPQAFIYIAGIVLYWLLINFKTKKTVLFFSAIMILGLLIDHFVLNRLSGKYFLYSVTARGIGAATQTVSGGSASDSLRGDVIVLSGIITVAKKVFYNLYNFYKLLPQTMSPYLFALFVIGIFKWGKDKTQNSFKVAVIFMTVITFLVAAASIPFFRYIHPVVPLIYIIAVAAIVEIIKSQITNHKLSIFISSLLVFIFVIGQTLGIIFLDSRFEANTHNVGQPPVYVVLSDILKQNTKFNDFIVTNLDTWGSWYGDRRTIWYPVEPKQLIDTKTGKIPFDAIYLTNYLIDDQNYYMNDDWRSIFNNPDNPKKWICDGCTEIAKEFRLSGVYTISPNDNYEKQDSKAVLFVRK